MTNNEVEYKVLLAGLAIIKSLRAAKVKLRVGFEVVVNQVK